MSREQILAAVAKNQPNHTPLPDLTPLKELEGGALEKFTEVLTGIGGRVVQAGSYEAIEASVVNLFGPSAKIVTPVAELKSLFSADKLNVADIHDFHDVDLVLIKGEFGVAENGAIWVTEKTMGHRVLPFICENLAIIIHASDIVPTMHKAYELMPESDAGFAAFIAGPSKTADIEQSLVIGAHGPKSMTAFILTN
ncbi:LUD domain-containing protein [Mucilaginibacter sp. RS28]|uniref:LUD domain-containing protein n=1 Tax=Mucilaginibacter straminoryzae TaxID=2932774 RepID=A0A9X1X1D3_9SPHI|nr:LUD domain-containing protein [Mucilaginibacter straminoryzae]MCJ8209258.1 LUD domain-containing protein [Mucilaginibacter straminoryzae]